jgi:hypothetical protein
MLWAVLFATASAQSWEKPIAPGVTYRMDVDLSVPRIVHAIRYSLGATGISLKSELAGGTVIEENSSKGRETMTEMVARTGALVAINGDFFPFTGDPLGVMVRDGQLISTPGIQRAVFGWGAKSSALGLVAFQGVAQINGQEINLKGINEECPLNEVVLNTDVAAFAMAKSPCVHAVFKMDKADWSPNGAFTGTFESLYADTPKLPIQPGNAILSAHGNKADVLKTLTTGQQVTFKFQTTGFDWSKIDQTMGGGPFLLRNSQIAVDAERQNFNDAFSKKRHPRTAIGRTSDGDLWIAVIDGRQKMSDGATLEETAKIMLKLGCVDAVNLDGGGSSAINIMGLLLNRPSDGKERPVANGLALMGPKPETMSIPLRIKVPEKIFLGQPKTLTVIDEAGKAVPNADVLWAALGGGWIDQGGLVRPMAKGAVDVSALVRGQLLRATIDIVEPEKIVPPKPTPKKVAAKPKRRKNGKG